MMTFKEVEEAEAKLRKMAQGEYCAVNFERITHKDGSKSEECMVYADGTRWFTGTTFEEALGKLAESLGIRQDEIPDQAPTAEDMEVV